MVGPRVNHEKHVAFFHVLPVFEFCFGKIPADPGADINGLHRFRPSREHDKVLDFPLLHCGYGDQGRRGRGFGFLVAGAERENERQGGKRQQAEQGGRIHSLFSIRIL